MITIKSTIGSQNADAMLNQNGKKKVSKKTLLILLGVLAVGGLAYYLISRSKKAGNSEGEGEGLEGIVEPPIEIPPAGE